jgi:hypothetical protein
VEANGGADGEPRGEAVDDVHLAPYRGRRGKTDRRACEVGGARPVRVLRASTTGN